MRLLQFANANQPGTPVWINPEHVVSLRPAFGKVAVTQVLTACGVEYAVEATENETVEALLGVPDAPAANLGLATNGDLLEEIRAREEMGHTDLNYRTVDPPEA